MAAADYDSTPYPQYAHYHTHPKTLAAIGSLLGLNNIPNIETCRVLELGCATGANIIAMAQDLPNAEFIGIDYSEKQIEQGNKIIQALDLKNIALQTCSIHDIHTDFGKFDFIVAQGIYSWVPDDIKDKTLEICGNNLTDNGIAYVSHNTYPMWHLSEIVRNMMKFHSQHWTDADKKTNEAKKFLGLMAGSLPQQNSFYGDIMRFEYSKIQGEDDSYISHDILEDVNDPVYLHEFVSHAKKHNLQFLGDTVSLKGRLDRVPTQMAQEIKSNAIDIVEHEQYLDFFSGRRFRRTLLCNSKNTLNKVVQFQNNDSLFISSLAQPVASQPNKSVDIINQYQLKDGTVATFNNPIAIMAMSFLTNINSNSTTYSNLVKATDDLLHSTKIPQFKNESLNKEIIAQFLNEWLLDLYANDFISITAKPQACVNEINTHPKSSPLARHQASYTNVVISFDHHNIVLNEFRSKLLTLLDGTHNIPDLITRMIEYEEGLGKNSSNKEKMTSRVNAALEFFAQNNLLSC